MKMLVGNKTLLFTLARVTPAIFTSTRNIFNSILPCIDRQSSLTFSSNLLYIIPSYDTVYYMIVGAHQGPAGTHCFHR